jgi:homoserine dehydrogenase
VAHGRCEVGLIGFGTVGKGVVRVLQNGDVIRERPGFRWRSRGSLTRTSSDRGVAVDPGC